VKFMVLSAPRSGSTWVANWLTTEKTLCLHDPILEYRVEALDFLPCDRTLGLSCTALALLPDFVNAHPAKKVVLHRDLREVNQSLCRIGLTRLPSSWDKALVKIDAIHCSFHDVFDPECAKILWEHLIPGIPFDAPRHANLRAMHIEPNFDKVKVVPDRAREFRHRLEEAFAS
jgi:hypothetical protein